VLTALVEQDMTISSLARSLSLSRVLISNVISGRRLSAKTEQRIAEYLGKPEDYLFPSRKLGKIRKMREAEARAKGRTV
jgi:transcriptional regulator with XRE-family HTH domain